MARRSRRDDTRITIEDLERVTAILRVLASEPYDLRVDIEKDPQACSRVLESLERELARRKHLMKERVRQLERMREKEQSNPQRAKSIPMMRSHRELKASDIGFTLRDDSEPEPPSAAYFRTYLFD